MSNNANRSDDQSATNSPDLPVKEERQSSSSSSSSTSSVARAAARGTLATLLLRLVSFACTQWTLRMLDPETLGRANIQLELLLTTVLFISREGFRLAITRSGGGEDENQESRGMSSWNVAWASIPVATLVSLLALVGHLYATTTTLRKPTAITTSTTEIQENLDYRWAGILYCLACCMEGWAEPAVLWHLRQMNVTVKASAEGLATVAKTVTTVVALQQWSNQWPVTAFGLAQMAYAVTYATFLYAKSWSQLQHHLPPFIIVRSHRTSSTANSSSQDESTPWYDRQTAYMVVVFTLQGFLKHLLTEGDRILLTTLSDSYDQGVYAMGSSYGSMAARIILQPIEENARLLWSRLATRPQAASKNRTTTNNVEVHGPLLESYTVLVKLVLYVGLVFSCLAVNYTSVLLNVLAGRKWGNNVEATRVLGAFCVYTAFLAWNGVTEAFVYGVASSAADMGQLSIAHSVIGIVFAVVASVTVAKYGTVGLVAANCLAMLFRATYSLVFAARYFAQQQGNTKKKTNLISTILTLLDAMFPQRIVMVAFLASFFATQWSLQRMTRQVQALGIGTGTLAWFKLAGQHVAVGASCAIGILSLAYVTERRFQRSVRSMWHGKQD